MFINNWGESPEELLARYAKQTPGNTGKWKNIIGTTDPTSADIFIVLGGYPENQKTDEERSIFIKREPDYIEATRTREFKNHIDWDNTHCGVTWWLSSSYDQLINMPYPVKTHSASCIVSTKHRHRNDFISRIYKNSLWKRKKAIQGMHLYGRGHKKTPAGKQYKGEIISTDNCKLPGLLPYSYSLVMENSIQRNYWTEKLADAYLAWCVPVYWGCPNISDFFPPESYVTINLDISADELSEIISMPVNEKTKSSLAAAREAILNEYNIWEVIWKKINSGIS